MENAAEALKIFLAVTVFGLALTVFFRMTSLARDTADMIFETINSKTYIDYTSYDAIASERTVTFEEIIPTIYRYSQAGYGVTIIDESSTNPGNIVARFDTDTEAQVQSCYWEYSDKRSDEEEKKSNAIKYQIEIYLKEYILNPIGFDIHEGVEGNYTAYTSHGSLNDLMKKIYPGTDSEGEDVFTGWGTGNTYKDNDITIRINLDIYGKYNGEDSYTYSAGTHNAVIDGGLLAKYKGKEFTEYIVLIDEDNDYITYTDEDGNTVNTGLFKFGTVRYTKKREIIYVLN